ncbi:MAG: hypothetical protein IJ710_02625 [Prevotella sp.]|nr:hypothetical protein [Prevotella sp.]
MTKRLFSTLSAALLCMLISAQTVNITTQRKATNREQYAAEYLQRKLQALGYDVTVTTDGRTRKAQHRITLCNAAANPKTQHPKEKESYTITPDRHGITITGADGSGVIYGCVEYADYVRQNGRLHCDAPQTEQPEMVLRGACVGLQKTVYLPGHQVYEYPYTPENFPWFYDKQQWTEYLDMLVDNKMNSLYLWNGHPFASLVKLDDYPFALEVDEPTFQKNVEMFSFLTREADRRGIFVIQMFYNIILSKPFAEHYGLKTQDRHRPITPLISDYTRKSIAAFIKNYPNVGLLVCLGEAMDTYEDDVEWFTKTIIPGVKDGLQALGRTDEPPLLLRAHDTDCQQVMQAALPLYKNLYTMHKYNGESLTTYEPRGPWAEMHRELAALGSTHISNVHILANLEPFRWSSPAFVRKTVGAMHDIHHANALHLYPQASYWDWPYTADRLPDGGRLKQLERDWMWYRAWGRYAWNCRRDTTAEAGYWDTTLAQQYGLDESDAALLRRAYDESGEIAPKLLRRFGITEGNRQTLLLGMLMAQLVNPYKFTIYPGFYESCGPEGEKLIEYVEREHKGLPHVGELPLDIVSQCEQHGDAAAAAIDAIALKATRHQAEMLRIQNDMHCYRLFAHSFAQKVRAAEHVLNYQHTQDIGELEAAIPLLQSSLDYYRQLVQRTRSTYLYANSMQTAQRRIPVGGDGGRMKTWEELLPRYEEELANLQRHIGELKNPAAAHTDELIRPLHPAAITLVSPAQTVTLKKGALLFENRPDTPIDSIAPELEGLQAYVLNRDTTRIKGTTLIFESTQPVRLLVGFFQDDDPKWAKPPKLEVDATGNEYGQAEPVIRNAVNMTQMPKVNIHVYQLPAGRQELRLPKGIIMIAGFTDANIQPRDAGLNGSTETVDWLFN